MAYCISLSSFTTTLSTLSVKQQPFSVLESTAFELFELSLAVVIIPLEVVASFPCKVLSYSSLVRRPGDNPRRFSLLLDMR